MRPNEYSYIGVIKERLFETFYYNKPYYNVVL